MENTEAYTMLMKGMELLESGNPAQAALVLEKVREMEPRKGSVLETLGRAYYGCRRYSEAAAMFESALEVDPSNDYAHYCLGLCYVKLRREDAAAGHFKLAWYLRPDEMYREKAAACGVSKAMTPDAREVPTGDHPEGAS